MAGYRGDNRQLAVVGSVNMKNPQIQQMLTEALEAMVEPSLRALAEGLNATKRRAFVIEAGDIRYSEPEPDHRIRTATASRILDHYQRTSCDDSACDEDAVSAAHGDDVELPAQPAREAKAEACGAHGLDDVAQFAAADRVLLRQVAEIDAQLAELDHERDDDDAHVPEHNAD